MPTKQDRRYVRQLVEGLERRAHAGPPPAETDIRSARQFLREHEFSTASDYYLRLGRLEQLVVSRPATPGLEKRNYGGEAAGRWWQAQSVYDHLILSTCYDGEFNLRRGRVKLSHRFNRAGRLDFVELKLLHALEPALDGSIRKLLMVRDYQHVRPDWQAAEAHVLRVLPRELVFLFDNIFRCQRDEALAWLINLGHWATADLLGELRAGRVNGCGRLHADSHPQLPLKELLGDEVARPILEQAASLEATVELPEPEKAVIRYLHR